MSKSIIDPIRKDAILIDENGRKWRVVKRGVSGLDNAEVVLEPDHTKCAKNAPCKHYGEIYF